MLKFFQKRWFLVSLLVLITAGLTTGTLLPEEQVNTFSSLIKPGWITSVVLFLMSFSLDSRQLKSSFRSPGPVLWASFVNFGVIPIMAWLLMSLQSTRDFAFGLMIAGSVPCTMAAASIWTRKAGGNDAVSLLVTVLTNGLCFLLTPFWLNWATTTTQTINLDVVEMFERLLWAALVPMLAGQAVRRFPRPAQFATKHKTSISVLAQSCMLTLVFSAGLKAGGRLMANGPSPGIDAVLLVWGSCIAVHLAAMGIGSLGARLFGFQWKDLVAVSFASSQKTLPIGVLIATSETMFGDPDFLGPGMGVPFVVFPMLMYHASQLFLDTVIADRLAEKGESVEACSVQ
ncbi:MAG: bile acid:sodium symporter [Planctomycetes bacterium]|nr:bile acid:sodium symporter [Planctomycetota bacterium]